LKDQFSKLRTKVNELQEYDGLNRDYLLDSLGVLVSTTLVGHEFGSYVKYPMQGALIGAGLGMVLVASVSASQISKVSLKLRLKI
jgi:hypothetical protein